MRHATVGWCGVVVVAALGLALGPLDPARAAPEGDGDLVAAVDSAALPALRKAGAVLVVEHVETGDKHFSGMGGPTFWLRIVDVLRFDAPASPRERPQHAELMARDARGLLLEWDILYPLDDAQAAAGGARLKAQVAGGRFVLTTPSAGAFSATGVVREGKWALVRGDVTLTPCSRGTLRALRQAIGAERGPAFGTGGWSGIDPTTWPADWPR